MDQYGCLKLEKEDAATVREALEATGLAVFPLSGDQIGCMLVFVSTKFAKIGVMPFGGNPSGRAYVGIYGRGCSHLSMGHIHPGYLAEKLGISEGDAELLSKFWDLLWNVKVTR